MKIWKSFSGDHSANLRIVGSFKTAKDAADAAALFNALLNVKDKERKQGRYFSDELLDVMRTHGFHSLSEHDPEQLDLFEPISAAGNKIIVETDDEEIQALIKVLIDKGAKVDIYSKHDYPG